MSQQLAEIAEQWLREAVAQSSPGAGPLDKALEYSLLGPGKRIRPVLILASADILGVPRERLRDLIVATEMIHAFSLVHDDLPSMDDDELRRGRPTCHVKFDEATALLAGDLLSIRAFSLVAGSSALLATEKARVVEELAIAAERLCQGQKMDLDVRDSKEEPNVEELRERHLLKTGALIKFSLHAPLFLDSVSVSVEERSALESFAENFGLLFQVIDDLSDVTASSEETGKSGFRDQELGVPSFATLLGSQGASEYARELYTEAKRSLQCFGPRAVILHELNEQLASKAKLS